MPILAEFRPTGKSNKSESGAEVACLRSRQKYRLICGPEKPFYASPVQEHDEYGAWHLTGVFLRCSSNSSNGDWHQKFLNQTVWKGQPCYYLATSRHRVNSETARVATGLWSRVYQERYSLPVRLVLPFPCLDCRERPLLRRYSRSLRHRCRRN